MPLLSGERQVSESIDGIREDHVSRYKFVASREAGRSIVDAACGIGYGANMLYEAGCTVLAVDNDAEAIEYGEEFYPGPEYKCIDLNETNDFKSDVAVCFETIEHIDSPEVLLKSFDCEKLYASVPNNDVFPWHEGIAFHKRHYTPAQFIELLNKCGWNVAQVYCQEDVDSERIEEGTDGRTIIAVCSKGKGQGKTLKQEKYAGTIPESVAILGLGPSLSEFVDVTKRLGGSSALVDEVWGINALGDVIKCDRVFHMDDVRIQEVRAKARPDGNIAKMLGWLKQHPGPIYTSRVHDDYPGLVGMPIEDMINNLHFAYFNSTAAWAIAYAIHIGVKKIALFGIDFTYSNSHQAEKGRACCEFWIGIAAQRGIKIQLPRSTTLMDSIETQQDRFYGYDTVFVDLVRKEGKTVCHFVENPFLPSADEIEARYDHNRPIHEQK